MSFGQLILEDDHGHREQAITLWHAAVARKIPLPVLVQAARAGELETWVVGPGHRLTTETELDKWRSKCPDPLAVEVDRAEIPSIELAYPVTSNSDLDAHRSQNTQIR